MERGKGSQQRKGGKHLREETGEDLKGGKGLRGKRGKGSQQRKGGKHLREETGEDLKGGKGLRGERGKGSQQAQGGKDLRGEGGQRDNSKGTQIRKKACNVGLQADPFLRSPNGPRSRDSTASNTQRFS